MIIIAASADWSKSSFSIHFDRWIAVANLKMNAHGAAKPGLVHEMVEQSPADALPMLLGAVIDP